MSTIGYQAPFLNRWLPPGVAFVIGEVIPNVFFPPLLAYWALSYLSKSNLILTAPPVVRALVSSSGWIPKLTRGLLYVFSPFVIPEIKGYRSSARKQRDAAKLGAKPVMNIVGVVPGNIDILLQVLHRWEDDYLGEPFREMLSTHGRTFNFRLLGDDQIFTTDPNHIKTILAADFPNYVKGNKFISRMQSVLGSGVFNSDGEMWKFHRSMARPYFSRDRISDFDIFARHSRDTIRLMKERFRTGLAVDFQDITQRFTLDSATEFLFGSCFHSLNTPIPLPFNATANSSHPTLPTTHTFAKAFVDALITVTLRHRVGKPWPFFEFFKDKTKGNMRIIYDHIEPVLDEALRKKKEVKEEKFVSEETTDTFLDHLVELTDDRILIRDAIVNMLVAGRDTTSSALTFSTYALATHPQVLARLRQEILQIIGSTNRPTYEALREMKYLRAVINETLRLFPPVPFDIRESVNSAVWTETDGSRLYIPAKTNTTYSVWTMQRNPDFWGPDAHIFDPDRWLDERFQKYNLANSFIFVPFNAGPRICLGQQFAYNEVSFFLTRLLQSFSEIALVPEAFAPGTLPPPSWKVGSTGRKAIEQIVPKAHLTLYVQGGLWLKMKEADIVETP